MHLNIVNNFLQLPNTIKSKRQTRVKSTDQVTQETKIQTQFVDASRKDVITNQQV